MLRLYDYLDSGNGYKVRLLLHLLDLPYERIECDIMAGATRTPQFLAKNPNGRIPLLELDDGRTLPESNAILYYLAQETAFFPGDRLDQAQVIQWMFFEQYSHEPYIAVLRHWRLHMILSAEQEARVPELMAKGQAALAVMERHLERHDFFVGDCLSIADIALYAYTHAAQDGGYDLAGYPAVTAWLARIAGHPRHIPVTQG